MDHDSQASNPEVGHAVSRVAAAALAPSGGNAAPKTTEGGGKYIEVSNIAVAMKVQ